MLVSSCLVKKEKSDLQYSVYMVYLYEQIFTGATLYICSQPN